jgi:flavin-dependent dehydrogenase
MLKPGTTTASPDKLKLIGHWPQIRIEDMKYDVVIIGAGLAGLQCARLLGKTGLQVLLVDRKNSLTQKIHTTGIFVRRTLEDFDIPDHCLGPVIKHVTLYSPKLRSLDLISPHDEFRIGRMGQLYEHYLKECLDLGVHWISDTSYEGYSRVAESLEIKLKVAGNPQIVTTRFLIGGDGACSRVARDLRLDENREWIVGVEEVLTGVPWSGPPRLLCFLDPRVAPGYIAWVAADGEETHVGVAGYAAKFDPNSALEVFRDNIRGVVELQNATRIERRAGRIPVGGVLRKIVNTDGLLIGDAAGAVSPLTAGGLDPCMRMSTLAARVTADFLSTGDPQVLNDYSGELFRSRFTSRIWARKAAAALNRWELAELACAVVRLPLARLFAKRVFFGRGSFPDVEQSSTTQQLIQPDMSEAQR